MRRISLQWLIVCLSLAAVCLIGCDNAQSRDGSDGSDKADEVPVPVEASHVIRGDISAYFVGTTSLEAEEEALVVAKTDGVVQRIYVEEGDMVKVGDALAKLEDDRLSLELARAEAGMDKLRRDYERNSELHDKKLISAGEYERVLSEYASQKAAVDLARLAVEHTTIRAPIDGVISERLIKIGNMVATHAAAFKITDFDPLLAVMHVPERELNKLNRGQRAEVRVDALPEDVFLGQVLRIGPVVDPATGTFKVTLAIRDTSRRLKPGMFGRVRIVHDTHRATLLVPREAVVREDKEAAVFVVRDSMTFRRVVQTGYENDRFVEIESGVDEGSQVITTGHTNLSDSTRIEVIGDVIANR